MTETSALLGPADIRRLAAELDVRPTKKLGQNFVHDPNTVRRIVATADLDPSDVVLEVGPGLGSLTLALLPAVRHVVAIEIDPTLAKRLPETVTERAPTLANRLTVLTADALRITADELALPITTGAADAPSSAPPHTSPTISPTSFQASASSTSSPSETPPSTPGSSPSPASATPASATPASATSSSAAIPSPASSPSQAASPSRSAPGRPAATPTTGRRAHPTALVANLPYNVSVPVVLHLLAELPTMTKALIMVQAEVADRIAAQPASKVYGIPSVKVAWYAHARRVATVPRSVFWPVPNVDSALVLLTRRPHPDADRATVFELVDAAFAQRRKTLRAALASWAGSPDRAADLLTRAGIDPAARGETLTVGDFASLARMAGKAHP